MTPGGFFEVTQRQHPAQAPGDPVFRPGSDRGPRSKLRRQLSRYRVALRLRHWRQPFLSVWAQSVCQGVTELEMRKKKPKTVVVTRLRRDGGGRKRLTENDPELLEALELLVEPTSRGDPMPDLKLAWRRLSGRCRPRSRARMSRSRSGSRHDTFAGSALRVARARLPSAMASATTISAAANANVTRIPVATASGRTVVMAVVADASANTAPMTDAPVMNPRLRDRLSRPEMTPRRSGRHAPHGAEFPLCV